MTFRTGSIYFFSFLIAIPFIIASCKQVDVYEKNTPIPHFKWQQSFAATGSFIINDTSSLYDIYVVLRHQDSYKYNNIWLNVGLQPPGDSMFFRNIDLNLANDATGWEGTGMNDIWEVRKLINDLISGEREFDDKPRRISKQGEYKFRITQIMRDNPLPAVMSAGLRVQKANIKLTNETR